MFSIKTKYSQVLSQAVAITLALFVLLAQANFAFAANANVESVVLTNSPLADLTIGEKGNFVIEARDDTNTATSTDDTLTVSLSDGGNGGVFYGGNINGGCNNTVRTDLSIVTGNTQKGFCYSNDTAGTYTIEVSGTTDAGPVSDSATVTVAPATTAELNAENFNTVDANYKGVSVGFNASDFGTVTSVEVILTRADNTTVTKTGNQGVFDLISNQAGPVQLTAPFVIEEVTFTEASDTQYWNPAPASWDYTTTPVKVTVSVTDENGTVEIENTNFSEGDPSWPTYVSLLPPTPASMVEVTESNLQGWEKYDDSYAQGGETSFVEDNTTPLGEGALQLETGDNDTRVGLYNDDFDLDIDGVEVAYESKQVSSDDVKNGNATIRIWIDTNDDDAWDDQLMYEPYYNGFDGTTMTGWQTWTISNTEGEFWSNTATSYNGKGGVGGGGGHATNFTINDVLADHPGATILGISFSMGTYNDYQAVNVDNFTIQNGSVNTIYDFEPEDQDLNDTTSTVTVTGDTSAGENQRGWLFNRDTSTDTPFEFNTDQAKIGNGSLYVLPIENLADNSTTTVDNSDKFIGEYFFLDEIANLDSFSYDFLIGNGGDSSDANEFYLNVYANFGESADDKYYDCKYDVVPTTGSIGGFTTVTFDPTATYPVTEHSSSPQVCPASPADMDALSTGSTIRAFAINLGDKSASDQGLDGYFDNVVLNTNSAITTFDFEPQTTTSNGGGSTSSNTGGSAGGSGSGRSISLSDNSNDGGANADNGNTPEGQVLGASTSVGECVVPYMFDYLKIGMSNDRFEVLKLQLMLLSEKYYNVGLTGVFDAATEAAVREFQLKYSDDILQPWVDLGLLEPGMSTGYVYKTTTWKINQSVCSNLDIPMPTLP